MWIGWLVFFSGFTRVWFSYTWMFHRQCFFARMIRSWNFHSLDLAMFYRVFVCLFVCFFFKWELREAGKVPTDQRFSMTGTDENKKNDSDRFSMWSLLFGGWKWPIFLVDIASFPFGFSRRWVRASRQSNDVGQRYRISFYTPTRFFSGPFFLSFHRFHGLLLLLLLLLFLLFLNSFFLKWFFNSREPADSDNSGVIEQCPEGPITPPPYRPSRQCRFIIALFELRVLHWWRIDTDGDRYNVVHHRSLRIKSPSLMKNRYGRWLKYTVLRS